MGIFSSYKRDAAQTAATTTEVDTPLSTDSDAPRKKNAPTPTRKQAEAERMARLHPKLTAKERKALANRESRERRDRAYASTENQPIRVLLRDHIDSGWHIGEFLLPLMLILLAIMFGTAQRNPRVSISVSYVMWVVLLVALVDVFFTWRSFKKLVAQRLPDQNNKRSYRGLFMYLMNRTMQIRRFRVPAPRIKRGASF